MTFLPTATELKARYTEFDSVADARLEIFLEEASRNVDDGWCEADRKPAMMALAAHKLALEGEPQRSIAIANGGTGTINPLTVSKDISMRKVGDVTTKFESSTSSGSSSSDNGINIDDGFDATPYGKMFKRLMRLNISTLRVV